ncbi:hypothetical protein [Nocardioides deserti]|uniref:Big-1 domain-containing protein n=1 Tax=Nocardioides deserti TaxID=1588644 RepID=A0ABR6U569_9ACTN|nr:hypothetical protein [Nocardioides deserti]MBC2959580.1 hypothetical protein [Nocardioides deserti]GGO73959.1 hypothetical protein GCM10012276_20820 [Nocardioides deserti]
MLRRLLLLVSSSLLALALAAPVTTAAADAPAPTPQTPTPTTPTTQPDVLLTLLVPHAEVGRPTPATLTATRDGEPVAGLVVEVTRTGPTVAEPATTTAVTDDAGVATFEVLVTAEGEFSVVATVTDATGALVGTAGPVVAQGYWLDSCGGGYPGITAPASGRCSPPEPIITRSKNARNGDDRIRVDNVAAGGTVRVRLFRHEGTGRQRIRTAEVAEGGHRWFRVTDHNSRRTTRYSVAIVPADGPRRTRTFQVR